MTKQSNTAHPRQSLFPKTNELPRVGLEPTTLCTLDRALYQLHTIHTTGAHILSPPPHTLSSPLLPTRAALPVWALSEVVCTSVRNDSPVHTPVEAASRSCCLSSVGTAGHTVDYPVCVCVCVCVCACYISMMTSKVPLLLYRPLDL